jgi:geranylgeranyl diphosphate synthase type II
MTAALPLGEYLRGQRERVDAALARYLPAPPACPPALSQAMRYSVFAGGKRLRPILALAAAEAVAAHPGAPSPPGLVAGGDARQAAATELALPAACALEMIHTYSLIHDDLPAMDNDALRRGRPTLHVVYNDALAILAGDALLTEALALVAREPQADAPAIAARKLRALAAIAAGAGAAGMVGGQVMDIEAERPLAGAPAPPRSADWLRAMHARKTGALIRASAVSGAIMAGGTEDLIAAIDRFAAELGLAFQIVDDILDVESDEATLGKTVGKDAAAGKLTYPALFGLEESRRRAAACVEAATAALRACGLDAGRLVEIAGWVTRRKN